MILEDKNAPQVKSLFMEGMKRGFTAERGIFLLFHYAGDCKSPEAEYYL